MNRQTAVRIILAVWVFIWALFLIRPYFKKDLLKEDRILLGSSYEGKRAYAAGYKLYEFIKFCNASLAPASTYKIIGLDEQPLDYRRAVYYLYPHIDKESPEFLLVFNVNDFSMKGYSAYKSLSPEGYILKRTN